MIKKILIIIYFQEQINLLILKWLFSITFAILMRAVSRIKHILTFETNLLAIIPLGSLIGELPSILNCTGIAWRIKLSFNVTFIHLDLHGIH